MPKTFDKIAKEQFKYLISDFQFHLAWCKSFGVGYDILYMNPVCGVHIVYEIGEAYVFIILHKLQNGKFVDNPRPITPETELTGYFLDDILLQRAPDAIIKPAYEYGEDSEFYDKKRGLSLFVSKFAQNLRKYAADVLAGDFRIFKTLEPIFKARVCG